MSRIEREVADGMIEQWCHETVVGAGKYNSRRAVCTIVGNMARDTVAIGESPSIG